ncbi:hypothetical protein BW727_100743 [Jeotgalibaca dankookensis]|uniref:LicD/FKTN/FKRP nucleotidyltransferase domain-containing protein n=1 Tax=Jeotgalibaca dankookensis TaxID=708126 RepID=A0A1S6INN1_9LACT|nr:LicD family protein [Jeotgalibaca dankookensis]AQS53136.1 hypothetical protein BW727_100743 [Jeotgalibaca dankookensis]
MDKYIVEPQTKAIQNYGLEILSVFHNICEANELKYILDFGTLLGAVRHQGFIPWDDDIDVAMPRKDFEKFKLIAKEQLPKSMFLQIHQTDPNYYNCIAKIRIPNSLYTEKAMQYFDMVHGPWLDIFVYDYKYDEKEKEAEKQRLYNKQRRFYPFIMETLVSDPSKHYTFIQKILKNSLRLLILKSQQKPERGFFMHYLDVKYKRLNHLIKKAPEKNQSGEMITYTFPIPSDSAEKGLRLNIDHFNHRKLQNFEEKQFYIPTDYHQILVDRYGKYQELPPFEERKSNHHWKDR